MKKCTKCGKEKMLTEFVKHIRYTDGYYSHCKECSYALNKEWTKNNQEKKSKLRADYRDRNREHIRQMDREYYQNNHEVRLETSRKAQLKYYKTDKGREKYNRHNRLQREKFPEKMRARSLLSNAIVEGKIVKPTRCSLCFSEDFVIEGHHTDYSKPYDVIWICRPCHGTVHRKIKSRRDRLSEKTSKEDATVKTCDESTRGSSEERTPPLKDGQ
jgi:hypothetical protein